MDGVQVQGTVIAKRTNTDDGVKVIYRIKVARGDDNTEIDKPLDEIIFTEGD